MTHATEQRSDTVRFALLKAIDAAFAKIEDRFPVLPDPAASDAMLVDELLAALDERGFEISEKPRRTLITREETTR